MEKPLTEQNKTEDAGHAPVTAQMEIMNRALLRMGKALEALQGEIMKSNAINQIYQENITTQRETEERRFHQQQETELQKAKMNYQNEKLKIENEHKIKVEKIKGWVTIISTLVGAGGVITSTVLALAS